MCNSNTTWSFECDKEYPCTIIFSIITERETDYLYLSINTDKETLIYPKISLSKSASEVYRTIDEIVVTDNVKYKSYLIKSVGLMLKIKDCKLSPVSTLFLTCELNENKKRRIFALSLGEVKEYGTIV